MGQRQGGAPGELSAGRKIAFTALLLGFALVVLELFAFATGLVSDDLYDHRHDVLDRIDPERLASVRERVDPVLGWDPSGPGVYREPNCLGEEIVYEVDADGARPYPGYRPEGVRVVVVGDSYTRGDEAQAEDSYPARLAEALGEPVANLGVGGFGPTQAVLRLERHLGRFPDTEVVVLGIMYENVYRMVNSHRAVLYDKTDPFSFKPYMDGGRVRPHPGAAAFESEEALRSHTNRAFDDDFWARPEHAFPYSAALVRALGGSYFRYRKLQKALRGLGLPEYALTFRSDAFVEELLGLLDRYVRFARQRGVTPVAVFLPRNRLDTESVRAMLKARADRLPEGLVVGDLGTQPVDWAGFNLEEPGDDNTCHPSPAGYRAIAEYVATQVGPLLPPATPPAARRMAAGRTSGENPAG